MLSPDQIIREIALEKAIHQSSNIAKIEVILKMANEFEAFIIGKRASPPTK